MSDLDGWFRDEQSRPAGGRNKPGSDADTNPDVFGGAPPPADQRTQAMPTTAQPADPTVRRPQDAAQQRPPGAQVPPAYAATGAGIAAPPAGGPQPPKAPQLRAPLPDGGYRSAGGYAGPPPPPGGRPSGRGGVPRPRPIRWFRRIVSLIAAVLVLYLAFYIGLAFWAVSRLDSVDAVKSYDGRPGNAAGQTWLLVGSDSRAGLSAEERKKLQTGGQKGARTDTIMLVHVPRNGGPTLVSIPRDSYVSIPGHGRNKINAAFALGGAPLLVRTVEQATGMRIDHYTEIGFAGIAGTTDAVGGVTVDVQRSINDPKVAAPIKAGKQKLNGVQALSYVRTRQGGRSDLDRVKRQRRFVAALMDTVVRPSTLLNPIRAARVTKSGTDSVRVDEDTGVIDLIGLGRALRTLSHGKGAEVTVPISNPDFRRGGAGSSVLWDEAKAAALFSTLKSGGKPESEKNES